MNKLAFPSTLPISKLTLGCWGLISDNHWGERDKSKSIQVVQAALDAGITVFDTAEMYGNGTSEELLGEALGEHRSEVLIATKMHFGSMTRDRIIASCEASLRRLQTDYIDLYQVHWPSPEVPLSESWEAMIRLQESGKVRAIGVCNCGPQQLAELATLQTPVTNQLPYNLLTRAIEFEILPSCREQQIGILAYSPLLHGVITDRFQSLAEVPDSRARTRHFGRNRPQIRHQEAGCETAMQEALAQLRALAKEWQSRLSDLALRWLLAEPQVASVIVGASAPEQLQANLQAVEQPLLPEQIEAINGATEKVKQALGANADLWQSGEQARIH